MIKNDNDGRLTLGIKCGDCIHYKRGPAKFESVCSELGVQSFAKAPNCFSPNVYALAKVSDDALTKLGSIVRDMTTQQLRLLIFSLRSSAQIHKVNLQFSQPVYFTLGGNYLSHYFKGFVIGVSDDFQHVIVSASLSGSCKTTLYMLVDSLLTGSQFKKKRVALVKAKRIKPRKPDSSLGNAIAEGELMLYNSAGVAVDIDYTPPTVDSAPVEWIDKRKAATKPDEFFDPTPTTRAARVASARTSSGSVVSIKRREGEE